MTTSTDPFDRTLSAWLESLEAEEPTGVTAWVVDRARTTPQRATWLASADLAVGLVRPPRIHGDAIRIIALAAALAAAVGIGILAGGARPVPPDVGPSVAPVVPGPSTGLLAPPVAPGAWATVDAPGLPPSGLAAADLIAGRIVVVGEEVLLFDPGDESWTRIAQPHLARRSPAVTSLLDGSVLIVGGQAATGDAGPPLASAELYRPVADRWFDAGPIAAARGSGHTATTLLDGRVLVAGGTEFAALPSAELFDPATVTWTRTGSMHEARSGHTATLLADGRVLVTGGSIVHTSASRTAEIFDPATGAWSAVAPMSTERTGHTATLLNDGSVLVTGGHLAIDDAALTQEFTAYPLGDGPLASAERFDPATGRWTPTGTMAVGRYGHTATLLSDGMVLVAGGRAADDRTATVEIFDPADGTWATTGAMARRRAGQTASLLADGSVLVVGGDLSLGVGATAERFAQP